MYKLYYVNSEIITYKLIDIDYIYFWIKVLSNHQYHHWIVSYSKQGTGFDPSNLNVPVIFYIIFCSNSIYLYSRDESTAFGVISLSYGRTAFAAWIILSLIRCCTPIQGLYGKIQAIKFFTFMKWNYLQATSSGINYHCLKPLRSGYLSLVDFTCSFIIRNVAKLGVSWRLFCFLIYFLNLKIGCYVFSYVKINYWI